MDGRARWFGPGEFRHWVLTGRVVLATVTRSVSLLAPFGRVGGRVSVVTAAPWPRRRIASRPAGSVRGEQAIGSNLATPTTVPGEQHDHCLRDHAVEAFDPVDP